MIYEYRCTNIDCGKVFEIFSNYKEEKDKECIYCKKIAKRIISQSNFKFITRGEYYDQNRQK